MKNKLRRPIATLIILACLTGATLQGHVATQSRSLLPVGRLKGIVVDMMDAPYPVSRIEIKGKKIKRYLSANEEGRFEIELPAGKYQITIKQSGFRRFRRKDIVVREDDTTELKVDLEGTLSVN